MRLRIPFRRLGRALVAFHRDGRGIESIEWMTTGLVICGIILFFATGLLDPLFELIFDQLDTVNPD
jgi:hypothetical protein